MIQTTFEIVAIACAGLCCLAGSNQDDDLQAKARSRLDRVTQVARQQKPKKQADPQKSKKADQTKSSPSKANAKRNPAKKITPISPQTRTKILGFVNKHHPELTRLLNSLEKNRPRQYQGAMHALQRDYERLTAVQERWPKRYPEALQQWKLKSRIQLLSAELAINDTPERRQKLKRLIAKQIDGRIHQLESEHEKLTARLEKVQSQLDKTQQNRDQEIRRAVASAVRSAERYKNRGKKTDAGAAADVKSKKNKSQKKSGDRSKQDKSLSKDQSKDD